jgi:hypothetical protein
MNESVALPVNVVNMHQPGITVRRILHEERVRFGRMVFAIQDTALWKATAK